MNILMCSPNFFTVNYEINEWMDAHDPSKAVNQERAMQQWQNLKTQYESVGGFVIELIEPDPNLPDQVFTANGALVINGKAMLPRFRFEERQPETRLFDDWLQAHGYETRMPEHDFEGEGDALVCNDYIFAGYGFRSTLESHQELADFFPEKEVISLKLVDGRFYHIDTCLTILDDATVAFFPGAFDEESQATIRKLIPNVIEADEGSAAGFGLNTMSDGQNVFMSADAPQLIDQIKTAGFTVHPIEIDEFRKSGGGIKCLTLMLRG